VSGIWLTSLANCFVEDLMLTQACKRAFQIPVKGLFSHVKWLITGDDVLFGLSDSFEDPKEAQDTLMGFMQLYNIVFKLDTLSGGEPYPKGLACHAPYLGRVSVVAGDRVITVPQEPRRNLGWYHTHKPAQTLQERYDSWVGIRESVLAYVVANAYDESIPIPRVVSNFLRDFEEKSKVWIASGQVVANSFPMTLAGAIAACTPLVL